MAVTAANGQTGKINGTVSTGDGYALEGADVSLVNISTGMVEETTLSDPNGSYSFVSVEPGSYRVEAEFEGGEDSRDVFDLGEGETKSRDLEITPEEAYFTVSVDGTNSPVTAGENIQVEVTVTNAGGEPGSDAVTLEVLGIGKGKVAELLDDINGGSSVQRTLTVPTDLDDTGNYTAEVSTTDDTEEVGFIVEQTDIGISITDTNSPITEGENLTVEAEVSNPDEISGNGTITAEVGGLGSYTEEFTLTGEDQKAESFDIPTESGDAGNYTVTVSIGEGTNYSTNVSIEEVVEENESETDGTGDGVTDDGDSGTEDSNESSTGDPDTGTDGSDGDGQDTQLFQGFDTGETLRYLGMGVAAVVALVVLVASSVFVARKVKQKDWSRDEPDGENGQDRVVLDTDSENEVYRSWSGMIERAGVEDIRTKTPNEIAKSAKEAGLDSEAVDELTDVFEEVRYGDAEPTAKQERRAKEAFERIKRNDRVE
jgi:hypothetical protein